MTALRPMRIDGVTYTVDRATPSGAIRVWGWRGTDARYAGPYCSFYGYTWREVRATLAREMAA